MKFGVSMISGKFLSAWLIGAASLRMLSVFIGIFKPSVFQEKVYRLRPDQVNPLQGRTFSAWTLVTCMLCVCTAVRMEEPTLYLATLGSFAIAFLKFSGEFFIFKTVDLKGFLSPLIISSVSIVWMALGWGTYSSYD